MPAQVVPGLSFWSEASQKAAANSSYASESSTRLTNPATSYPRTPLPGPGQLLLITDDLTSPGEFLLHSCLISRLKSTDGSGRATARRRRAMVVSSRSEVHWKTIGSKLSFSTNQYVTSGALKFIQPQFDLLHDSSISSPEPLAATFDLITQFLTTNIDESQNERMADEAGARTMIVIDDLSSLEWIGVPSLYLVRFVRALEALVYKHGASLVILTHTYQIDQPGELLRHLIQSCDIWVQVSSLSSGRSGAVSGQISIHPGHRTWMDPGFKGIPRSRALHYRLSDTGPVFFERGTGGVVL